MIRVLFVDHERRVLDALRRLLRPMRREWEMEFVATSERALKRMDDDPFDVIVADLQMPGMSGIDLLTRVKAEHPETVRLVLSSRIDQESSLRLIGLAHQFLAKPCDPEHLKVVVKRAAALRERLRNEDLLRVVAGISHLPSMPALYSELIALVESERSTLAEIGDVVGRDPGMAAKVLQLVNSSFFGLRRRVTDAAQAVSFVGLDNLVALVLGRHIFGELEAASAAGVSVTRMYERTLAIAGAAKQIAFLEDVDQHVANEFFLAGLLHDSGRLVLAANYPEAFLAASASDEESVIAAEIAELGTSHQEVGAYLLGLWGLPDVVVEAAAFHHDPSNAPSDQFAALTAVHVAQAVIDAESGAPDLDWDYLKSVGVDDRVDAWVKDAATALT